MSETKNIQVRTMANLMAEGKKAEYLFWVGSAGSYDDRAKKISIAFVKLLEYCGVDYAVLGEEETDTGDSAKRAGNEFLFQMQAMQNIEVMNAYEVKKIITCDPHDYNTIKNEYPELGGNYEITHHSVFIEQLITDGKLKLNDSVFSGKNITFHDPCYLGRGNKIYDAPRNVLKSLNGNLVEMHRNKSRALCCGAGGAQMFKEAEKGDMEIFEMRTQDAIEINPDIIATACPFCMVMFTDGLKMIEKEDNIQVLDIVEIIVESLKL